MVISEVEVYCSNVECIRNNQGKCLANTIHLRVIDDFDSLECKTFQEK